MFRGRAEDSVSAGICRWTNVAIDLHKGPVEGALNQDERYHMAVDARTTSATPGRARSNTRPQSVHPSASAPTPPPPHGPLAWLETRALFVTAVAVVIVMSTADIPAHLAQDSYLALVAGRIIAAHGIPHHDYLTIMAHGVRWTDQQWLAQLVMYGLVWLGGLQLLSASYVLLTGCAFALALAAARRLGGRDLHVLAMLPLGTFFYLATAISIRTQGFAYPLFVAVVWLLAAETRHPARRRAYLVFPMLVLWANLHGSVTLGVGIAMVYGACVLAGGYASNGSARPPQRAGCHLRGRPTADVAGDSVRNLDHPLLPRHPLQQRVRQARHRVAARDLVHAARGSVAAPDRGHDLGARPQRAPDPAV